MFKLYFVLQCASIPATYHLIQQTDPSQPTKLMILGTACSGASHLMGEVAQRILNITQVCHMELLLCIDIQSLLIILGSLYGF